jgi:uncharacterized protein
MKQALIIFVRRPEAGKVKTRLAAGIGAENALAVYLKLLHHTRDVALASAACDPYIFATESQPHDLWKDFFHEHQAGGDLGTKMSHAFDSLFQKNYEKVVIIGSDCPDLSARHISEAFDSLNKYDVVLGPAQDGGYYLLGMKKNYPEIFMEKKWSTPLVFEQTVHTLKKLQLQYQLLPTLVDIDEAKDLPPGFLAAAIAAVDLNQDVV